MSKPKLDKKTIKEIGHMRTSGKSISEISQSLGVSRSSVSKYIQNIKLNKKAYKILQNKKNKSKIDSENKWIESKNRAKDLLGFIDDRDKLIILASLYWGEGNKKEFNFINGDPDMISVLLDCLYVIGVEKIMIKLSIRVYNNDDRDNINFWHNHTKIPLENIKIGERVDNKNIKNKFQYGMCRVRIVKSQDYFKLIMSSVSVIIDKTSL